MKFSRDTILSVLSSYGISLSDEGLNQLEERLRAQSRLIEMLGSKDNLENFALKPKWATLMDLAKVQMEFPPSSQYSSTLGFFDESRGSVPSETVEKSLEAIESYPNANVFVKVFKTQAYQEAKKLEERYGQSKLPLWGTTVAVKDLIAMAGHRMTGGSVVLDRPLPDKDAPIVKRLRQAGALVIGAANLHELAFGTTSENPHFGTVANPVNQDYLAGGSSGGSAAAVRFGMSSFGLGTDTGGSIRIPAACCGIVGFKPSFGLLPLEGVFPLGYTLDHVGPLTNTVKQAALVTEIMANQTGLFTSKINDTIDGLKIGVPEDFFLEGIEEEVQGAHHEVVEKLQKKGAKLISVKLPYHRLAPAAYLCTSGPEALGIHFRRVIEHGLQLSWDVYIRLLAVLFIPVYARVIAQRVRDKMYLELNDAFKQVDILVTPTLPITVPRVGMKKVNLGGNSVDVGSALLRNTSPFNLTGAPALTLPFDKDKNGMPLNLQIAGPYSKDLLLLKAAYAMEKVLLC